MNVPAVFPCDLEKRSKVKAAGGRWHAEEGLWYVRHGNIAGAALERHIQVGLFPPDQDPKSLY